MTKTFEDFGLSPELLKGIQEVGYTSPTPIQAQTIPLLLKGQDVIGCAQTGTGKTAAFSLPLLQALSGNAENPQALILTPTRELADQIHKSIQDYSQHLPTRTVVVYGGASSRFQEHNLQKGVDILVATPGRLKDFLEKRVIRLYDIKYFVLDEADRMLDMGFIPDIEEILSYIPRQRQTLLFSATMPPEIEKLARKMTHDAVLIEAGTRSATAETVTQGVFQIGKRDKFKLLLDLLEQDEMSSVIVFCGTKVGTTRLARDLIRRGVLATPIHSNLTQSQRERSLQGFRSGEYGVLVATDVAARGIDISDVSHVINYDTPSHPEDYVHRIGRTGRAEATGEAITFTTPEEKKYLRRIEQLIGKSIPRLDTQKPAAAKPESVRSESPSAQKQAKGKRARKALVEAPVEARAEAPASNRSRKSETRKAERRQPVAVVTVPEKRSESSARKASRNPSPARAESLDLSESMVALAESKSGGRGRKQKRTPKWDHNPGQAPLGQVPHSRKRFKNQASTQGQPTASAYARHFFDHPDDIDYLDED